MTIKRRNPQAGAAWTRKGGAHSGAKRPDVDDTEEQLEELLEEIVYVVEGCDGYSGACYFQSIHRSRKGAEEAERLGKEDDELPGLEWDIREKVLLP